MLHEFDIKSARSCWTHGDRQSPSNGVIDPPEAQRFAAWGVAEVMKSLAHAGQPLSLSHWMTATGVETGMVVSYEAGPVAVSFTRMPAAPR